MVIIMRDMKDKTLKGKINSYTLKEHLKGGGFGEVWTAQSINGPTIQNVAVKMLSERERTKATAKKSFYTEGKNILAMPSHPHILRPLEIILSEGEYYLVMPLMQKSLKDYIDAKEDLSGEFISYVMKGIGEALVHAHANGMLHRDIHPGNILFQEVEGKCKVYLSDFGLARVLQGSPLLQKAKELGGDSSNKPLEVQVQELSRRGSRGNDSDNVRATNICVGFRAYASPEVLAVDSVEVATELSDLFSLAKVGNALNGEKNNQLQKVLEKGMQYLPKNRYSSVKEFVDAINGLRDYVREISAFNPKTLTNEKITQLYALAQEAYIQEPSNRKEFKNLLELIDSDYSILKMDLLGRIEQTKGTNPLQLVKEIRIGIRELEKIEKMYKND